MSKIEDINELDMLFEGNGITNFTGKEICNGWDIPDELLLNILPTVMCLQILRDYYKKPIYPNSTYRSPDYNKAVNGAKNSLHLRFNAIDFTVKNHKDLNRLYLFLDFKDISSGFGFLPKNSLGLKQYETFIHLDTRTTLGMRKARW